MQIKRELFHYICIMHPALGFEFIMFSDRLYV